MKLVTEFWNIHLQKGLNARQSLTTEGKTPEEIQEALGTTFKFEGDKLKHFVNALGVATEHAEGLSRVLVMTLAEGENVPQKSTRIEEWYYVPEFQMAPKPVVGKQDRNSGNKGKKGKGSGPKESPWGLSPEQAAAKKGAKNASKPS